MDAGLSKIIYCNDSLVGTRNTVDQVGGRNGDLIQGGELPLDISPFTKEYIGREAVLVAAVGTRFPCSH